MTPDEHVLSSAGQQSSQGAADETSTAPPLAQARGRFYARISYGKDEKIVMPLFNLATCDAVSLNDPESDIDGVLFEYPTSKAGWPGRH